MARIVFGILVWAFILNSCGMIHTREERGNGKIQTETRPQKKFKGVESRGSFDVYVTTDNSYSVKIEADENLLQYIETSMDGDDLKISTSSDISLEPSGKVKIYVSAPEFNKLSSSGSGNILGQNRIISSGKLDLSVSGSGDINADVKASSLSAEIAGSGDMTLSGEATFFSSSIAGEGNIKAGSLKTEEATVNIAGSGDALLDVSKKLSVHIAGSGDVKYTGNPSVSQQVMGSGNIEKVQ